MAGLGGLAFVGEGYEQGLSDFLKVQQQSDELRGRQAFGKTLMMLNGQDPNAAPGLSPSVPSPAGGAGALPGLGAGGPPGAAPMPAPGPGPAPMFAPRPPATPGAPPMGVRPPGPVMPPPMQRPMGGVPPQAGGPPAGPQGVGGVPGGGFDWRQVLGAVVKANPGASPSVIAAAVDQFLPIMNAQAQMQWREQANMLRGMALDERSREFDERERRLNQQLDDLNQYRTDQGNRADRRLGQGDVRLEQGERRLTEQERRNQASEALRAKGQENAMTRFREGLEVRKDANAERVRHNMAAEAQAIATQLQRAQQAGDRVALSLLQQQNRALWERTAKEIQISTNITDPAEKKRLSTENDQRYTQVQRQIDAVRQGVGKGNPGFQDRFNAATEQPGLTQGPAGMAVPDGYKDQADGTVFHMSNGRDMVKRGDRLVPVSEDNGQR